MQYRDKLYSTMFLACIGGYGWLYFSKAHYLTGHKSVEVCLIKYLTGIPCPSCGVTRAIILLTEGNIAEALKINPLGFIVAIIMLVAPIWIVLDVVAKSSTLFDFYRRVESYLKSPYYAVPLVLLVMSNWVWNIMKGL